MRHHTGLNLSLLDFSHLTAMHRFARSARVGRRGHKSFSTSTGTLRAQITTLSNNIRIATDTTPGHFSSVGLYIDAGSRYETESTSGVSHFLDRMAFKVSLSCRSPAYPSNSSIVHFNTNRRRHVDRNPQARWADNVFVLSRIYNVPIFTFPEINARCTRPHR